MRVIVNGAWGFASSPLVTPEEIARITGEAVIIAKANATIQPKPVQLAPVKAYRDRWVTPHEKDPFAVPMAEKLDLLRRVIGRGQEEHQSLQRARPRSTCAARTSTSRRPKGRPSSSSFCRSTATSMPPRSIARTTSRARAITCRPRHRPAGSTCPEMNLEENAQRIREEVVEHLSAPAVKPGKKDLLLMPNHLMLTIHESVGHPTELDRTLGIRGQLRRHQLHHARQDRQADRERALHVHRRPHVAARAGHLRLRRRRREDHRSSPSSTKAFSATSRPPASRRTWWATRNRTAAARRIRGPRFRSSACPTSG